MTIKDLLLEQRDAIIRDWIDVIYGTYAIDTVGFLRSQDNQFNNPVGHKTKQAVPILIDALLGPDEMASETIAEAVDEIVRVRAVQKFTPEQGMAVFFLLKNLFRKHLGDALNSVELYEELLDLESRVDSLVLVACKVFVECREKIQKLRVDEIRRKQSQLIRRAERILGNPDGEPDM